VNARHLLAFIWLRWRLRVNQIKRAGMVNFVLTAMFVAAMIPGALVLFAGAFAAGVFGLPAAKEAAGDADFASILMLIWDGIIGIFLMAWTIGLLAELQRSEALSIDKFLHLPVSVSGVFLINYISSLASLNLLVFVPIMLGLTLGMAVGLSPSMLLLLPLIGAFLLAVTAPTYQFQGWLAALMVNPRKRRTVVVGITMAIIMVSQLPNLVNLWQPWHQNRESELAQEQVTAHQKLNEELAAHKITPDEHNRRNFEITKEYQEKRALLERRVWDQVKWWAHIVNMALPPAWLALGAAELDQGNLWPALGATLGLALIGTASLWRAYRTTLRLYTGQLGAAARKPVVAPVPAIAKRPRPAIALMERSVPGLSERASAIAFGSFRALMRAPEVKMILLTPLIMLLVFGSLLLARAGSPPDPVLPLLPMAGMAMTLLSMTQIVGNQFGFDRSGFRVFVLCPAPRREILLGKNIAAAPIALGIAAAMAVLIEAFYPMRVDVFLAVLVQFVSMYLLYCVLANCVAILAPVPVAPGSSKPVNWKTVPILIHMSFVFLYPMVMVPVLVPFGLQFLVDELSSLPGVPVALVLALLECAGIIYLYRAVITWQGKLLQSREQKILEVVTTKAE
jgi:ABC-2 type transport system permease protein